MIKGVRGDNNARQGVRGDKTIMQGKGSEGTACPLN